MVEKLKVERAEGEKPITAKQVELVEQLYKETSYKRTYEKTELEGLFQKDAQAHIDFLLGYKRRMLAMEDIDARLRNFDKIAYAMIFKMVWNHQADLLPASQENRKGFIKKCYNEYMLFQEAREYANKQISKKAVK